MRNIHLSRPTAADIERQVQKVLRGLGNPEPPLRLDDVRELLRLDRRYYSTTDDGVLREMISRMTVAGAQVVERPMLLLEAVKKFDLRALFLPDRKRILLDTSQPEPKLRWNEAHEIGHSIIPWHDDAMLGDHEQTLTQGCHAQIEAEANYAAGQLLFLQDRFLMAANDSAPTLSAVRALKGDFGNTYTTTFWRFIESTHRHLPMIGMIGPHPRRSPANFNDAEPFRHIIESPAFRAQFPSVAARTLHAAVASYCGGQRAGPLGSDEILLQDAAGSSHIFAFETFSNTYDCLTLGVYQRPYSKVVSF